MIKWEYKIVAWPQEWVVDKLGLEGWELVTISDYKKATWVFKRPIVTKKAKKKIVESGYGP